MTPCIEQCSIDILKKKGGGAQIILIKYVIFGRVGCITANLQILNDGLNIAFCSTNRSQSCCFGDLDSTTIPQQKTK